MQSVRIKSTAAGQGWRWTRFKPCSSGLKSASLFMLRCSGLQCSRLKSASLFILRIVVWCSGLQCSRLKSASLFMLQWSGLQCSGLKSASLFMLRCSGFSCYNVVAYNVVAPNLHRFSCYNVVTTVACNVVALNMHHFSSYIASLYQWSCPPLYTICSIFRLCNIHLDVDLFAECCIQYIAFLDCVIGCGPFCRVLCGFIRGPGSLVSLSSWLPHKEAFFWGKAYPSSQGSRW